jgi:hypothetical protein
MVSVYNMLDVFTFTATVITNYIAGIITSRFSAFIVKARHFTRS